MNRDNNFKKWKSHRHGKIKHAFPRQYKHTVTAATEDSFSFLLSSLGNAQVAQLVKELQIQTKSVLNTPGDKYEQQADRFAEQMLQMPPVELPADVPFKTLQAKGESGGLVSPEVEAGILQLKGQGSPLNQPLQDYFNPRFGVDLCDVRVHTGEKANALAKALKARAFTFGNEIVFGQGEYRPENTEGKKLIGHELVHTLQQNGTLQRAVSPGVIQRLDVKGPPGKPVNKAGIVFEDYVNLRSSPDTSSSANFIQRLNFNTVLLILTELENGWSYIRTQQGVEGYVASAYLKDNLPEPNACLHLVTPGESAIGIAEHYYKPHAQDWGQDLRFFVNVLVHVNKGAGDVSRGIYTVESDDTWKQANVQSGYYIWIPSIEYAKQLVGQVKSGSISYEFISGLSPKIADFVLAFQLSGQYIPGAIKEVIIDPFLENIISIAIFMAAFLGMTMLLNFIGGVGGAIGILILNLIGLGFMVSLLAKTLWDLGGAFIDFFTKVWSADGDRDIIEEGAKDFARAIALLIKAIIEGILTYFAGKGVASAFKNLSSTKFGEWFGKSKLSEWLEPKQFIKVKMEHILHGELTHKITFKGG